MFNRARNSKDKIESIKSGDDKLFTNPPRYSKLFTPSEEKNFGRELEIYLRERKLLGILQRAGSVGNIQDPILYRRVLNAIYEFCLINNILPEDPPENTTSLRNK